MTQKNVLSDQLLYWSDNEEQISHISSAKAKNSFRQTPSSRCCSPRLPDRALQTLWQARVQMCAWSWSWSQVLPVRQPGRRQTADGLRSPEVPRAGRRVPCEFSQDKAALGRNMYDQPGASTPQGAIVDDGHGIRDRRNDNIFSRHRGDRHSLCQYARSNSASRFWRTLCRGG
jgi:hypothetical protein